MVAIQYISPVAIKTQGTGAGRWRGIVSTSQRLNGRREKNGPLAHSTVGAAHGSPSALKVSTIMHQGRVALGRGRRSRRAPR